MSDQAAKALLSVRNLVVEFDTRYGPVRAVDDVSFDIFANETVGIVGESGCGKTVTGLSLLRLVPSPPGRIVQGSIVLNGKDIVQIPESDMAQLRGNDISMIFQEPMTALNPVLSVGAQMTDVLRQHRNMTRREARDVAIDMLAKVGIPVPEKRIDEYPHELSGGMRQRVMIAMALSCNPKVLVGADRRVAGRVSHGGYPHHARSRRDCRNLPTSHGHVLRQCR
jgi:ABC-type dipeptide/oligopeptide/nickel transport system ATPase component